MTLPGDTAPPGVLAAGVAGVLATLSTPVDARFQAAENAAGSAKAVAAFPTGAIGLASCQLRRARLTGPSAAAAARVGDLTLGPAKPVASVAGGVLSDGRPEKASGAIGALKRACCLQLPPHMRVAASHLCSVPHNVRQHSHSTDPGSI